MIVKIYTSAQLEDFARKKREASFFLGDRRRVLWLMYMILLTLLAANRTGSI